MISVHKSELEAEFPLRVFWSFAASHFTSLQRINLYRIYIHQVWAAAAAWALRYFTGVKIEGRRAAVHWRRYARVSNLVHQWTVTVDQCSGVHWGRYARVSRVPMRSDTVTSLSWEHLIKKSQNINSDLVSFLQSLMRISQFGFGWANSRSLLLWSDPFNGVGIATRKWRKLQIFAALHHYVVLQIWLW